MKRYVSANFLSSTRHLVVVVFVIIAAGCSSARIIPNKNAILQAKSIGYYVDKKTTHYILGSLGTMASAALRDHDKVDIELNSDAYIDAFNKELVDGLSNKISGKITIVNIRDVDGDVVKKHGFDYMLKTTIDTTISPVPTDNPVNMLGECYLAVNADIEMLRVIDNTVVWALPVKSSEIAKSSYHCNTVCENGECSQILNRLSKFSAKKIIRSF